MPIYEYFCRQCGYEKEIIQRFSDEPLTECEKCSGKLEKKISVSSFHLRGSGWYVTDYARKNSPSNHSEPSGNAAAKDSGKAESKSDTPSSKENTTSTPKKESSSSSAVAGA